MTIERKKTCVKRTKKKSKTFSYVYSSPEGDLVYTSKKLHDKIQDVMAWHPQNYKHGKFDYQNRNLLEVVLKLTYIKKLELKSVKNFTISFQTYITTRFPLPKEPKCRFSNEFKSKLKYDMIADLFISGKPLFNEILSEPDAELRDLKLQYFYEPYGYPLFKLPNSNSKELWSGLVSEDALLQLSTMVKPEIEREHAMARSVVIPKMFTDYFEFIELNKGDFIKALFESPNGFGTFHLVTKRENSRLKEFQTEDILSNPLSAYTKAKIKLINVGDGAGVLYNIPRVNWWVSGKARYDASLTNPEIIESDDLQEFEVGVFSEMIEN